MTPYKPLLSERNTEKKNPAAADSPETQFNHRKANGLTYREKSLPVCPAGKKMKIHYSVEHIDGFA